MTTITPSITPTPTLTRWRSEHSERYPFVLSDSSPSPERSSFDPSCIRNRKAWLIDHTLYVSSHSEGTRPLQSPTPKEFHEIQWGSEYGSKGRLVEQREIPLTSSDRPSELSPPGTEDTTSHSDSSKKHHHSFSGDTALKKLVRKLSWVKNEAEGDQRRRSWLHGASSIFKDKQPDANFFSTPLPDGCKIPNAIFARKHQLVEVGDSLSPELHISQMPIAEYKATNTIVEAASSGWLDKPSQWSFRGPFTPQLGFDSGLDYQWGHREPTITVRRFDIDCPPESDGEILRPSVYRESCQRKYKSSPVHQRSSAKRKGIVFGMGDISDWECGSPSQGEMSGISTSTMDKKPNTSLHRIEDPTTISVSRRALLLSRIAEDTVPPK